MIEPVLADQLTKIASLQLEAGLEVRKPRIKKIQSFIDLYQNEVRKVSTNRSNIPIPVLSGFVETLKAKIDDPPKINFGWKELSDLRRSKKVGSAWEIDSSPIRGKWDIKDLMVKSDAIFSGIGIYKYFASKEPKYKSHFDNVDFMDFVCQARRGWDLEKHDYAGQINIEIAEYKLDEGVKDEVYDKIQVERLKAVLGVTGTDAYKNAAEMRARLNSMGMNLTAQTDHASKTHLFVEWGMWHEGTKYYLLFEPTSKTWIRAEKWEDIFNTEKWDWVAWHTHPENYNFWSKGPCDDVYNIAQAMNLIINYGIDNIKKVTWPQRVFDPVMFTEPSLLEYREDGIIPATVSDMTKSVSNGIYTFETKDNTSIVIRLTDYLNSILSQKTAVSNEIQGQSKEKKVGIAYLNAQQSADKLGLLNKHYKQSWAELGWLYWNGLKHNITEGFLVKMIGTRGIEWEELTKDDLKEVEDFEIEITGGNAEALADSQKMKQRAETLASIAQNPLLASKLNTDVLIEEILRSGQFEEQEIKRIKDTQSFASLEELSVADQAIQDVLSGKEPKVHSGAGVGFVQYILDFVHSKTLNKNPIKDKELKLKLQDFVEAHMNIATENMTRQAIQVRTQKGMGLPESAPSFESPKFESPKIESSPERTYPQSPQSQILTQVAQSTA